MNLLPNSMIRALQHQLSALVRLCRITAIDDGKALQNADVVVTDGETIEGVDRHQEYGFTSHPVDGVGLCISIGQHRWVIGIENEARPGDLQPGEVMFYHQNGDQIHLQDGNNIRIKTNTLTVDAQNSHFSGDIQCNGTVTATVDVVGGTKSLKTHRHSHTGSPPI